jgi:hypothetical protein
VHPAEADAFLKSLSEAKGEEFPAVGEGVDIRVSGHNLTGAALAVDNRIIHLSAFLNMRNDWFGKAVCSSRMIHLSRVIGCGEGACGAASKIPSRVPRPKSQVSTERMT